MDVLARARALAAADALGAITASTLVVLAERARVLTLAIGARAATTVDGAPVVLVVVDGEVDDGHGRHGPGALVGVAGVLATAAPRVVVTARAPSRLLELDGDDVLDALAAEPDAARIVARPAVARAPSPWPARLRALAAPLVVAAAGSTLLAFGPAALTDHRPALALAVTALAALLAWWTLAGPRTRPVRAAPIALDVSARERRERAAVVTALAPPDARAGALALTNLSEGDADRTLADLPVTPTVERVGLARMLAAAPTPGPLLAALAEDDDEDVQGAALRSLLAHARAGHPPPSALVERLVERERAATAMLAAARPARGAGPALHADEVDRALHLAVERLLRALALSAAGAGRPLLPARVACQRLCAAPPAAVGRALEGLGAHVAVAPAVHDTLARALRPSTRADPRAWSRVGAWLGALLAGDHAVREPAIAALRASQIFATLPGQHADDLAARADHRFVLPDEVLVRRGEPGRALIAVISGALVADEPAAAPHGPGAILGERALLDDVPWPATLRATTLTEVLVLDRPTFAAALARWPALGVALARALRA